MKTSAWEFGNQAFSTHATRGLTLAAVETALAAPMPRKTRRRIGFTTAILVQASDEESKGPYFNRRCRPEFGHTGLPRNAV